MVDRSAVAPGESEVHGDHDVRPQAAEFRGQVAAQRYAVFHQSVWVVEEHHLAYPDDRRTAPLLFLAEWAHAIGGHPRDTCLTPGRDHIGDVAAGRRPAGDGGSSPYSRSSGWATAATARSQSSGIGCIATPISRKSTNVGDAWRGPLRTCEPVTERYDIISIGSGAGGDTLARAYVRRKEVSPGHEPSLRSRSPQRPGRPVERNETDGARGCGAAGRSRVDHNF